MLLDLFNTAYDNLSSHITICVPAPWWSNGPLRSEVRVAIFENDPSKDNGEPLDLCRRNQRGDARVQVLRAEHLHALRAVACRPGALPLKVDKFRDDHGHGCVHNSDCHGDSDGNAGAQPVEFSKVGTHFLGVGRLVKVVLQIAGLLCIAQAVAVA